MAFIGRCAYCSAENVIVAGIPEHEPYCKDCNELTMDNCERAIAEIELFEENCDSDE